MIEMSVTEVILDEQTNTPVVVLREKNGDRSLFIWVGLMEATAIAMKLEEVSFPRPMTHDLMKNLLDHLKVKVNRVEVCDLRENTYYALIYLQTQEGEYAIDSRPSDAIALALRTKSPIFVADKVIQKSIQSEERKVTVLDTKDKEKLAEILEQMDPEDFGKYKM